MREDLSVYGSLKLRFFLSAIRKFRGKFIPGRIAKVKRQILKKKGKSGSKSLSRISSSTFSKVNLFPL